MLGCESMAQQDRVIGLRADVVKQHAHPHTAVCGAQQRVGEDAPGQVVVPDVVLDIQRTLRRIGQDDACQEGIDAASQRAKAALARVSLQCGVTLSSKCRRGRVLKCMRLIARDVVGQARAATENQSKRGNDESAQQHQRSAQSRRMSPYSPTARVSVPVVLTGALHARSNDIVMLDRYFTGYSLMRDG